MEGRQLRRPVSSISVCLLAAGVSWVGLASDPLLAQSEAPEGVAVLVDISQSVAIPQNRIGSIRRTVSTLLFQGGIMSRQHGR